MSEFYFVLLCVAFILGGLYYIAQGLRRRRQLSASAHWPSTQGVVLQSEAKKRLTSPGTVVRDSHVFYALIRYQYEVHGRRYESDVIELGGRLRATLPQIQSQVQQFRHGRAVTVYYDPQDPAQACLLRQGPGGWMNIIGGSGFALLGAWLLLG